MSESTLFDMAPAPAMPAEPEEKLSYGRRLTIRQRDALTRGVHPLALLFGARISLRPDAPREKGGDGPTCGTCAFRRLWGAHSFPKCTFGADSRGDYPRASHGQATDVRAWWGACRDWAPVQEEAKADG